MRLVIALSVVVLAAGCVTVPAETPATVADTAASAAVWTDVAALMADVPCEAPMSSTETTDNFLSLGKLTLEDAGQMGELDIRGDRAVIARSQSIDLVDISDPRAPVLLGSAMFEVSPADVKFIPGMEAAVVGIYEGQLLVVDLADPTNLVVVGEAEVATQAHMVQPAVLGDKTYIYVASQSGSTPAFIYEMEGWTPKLVGSFSPTLEPLLGNHDITILNDTMLGDKPTLYLADGLMGWSVWNLDDPLAPERIGGSIGHELGVGYTHTIRVGFFEDRRIVVTMQEVGQNTLKVYDATDLSRPQLLARWNADPTRPQIPQHNIQLLGDLLFMAHYTEGVYVFNLSGVVNGPPLLGTLALKPMAHYAVEDPTDGGPLGFANVWDVAVRRGVVYATSLNGHLDAIGFGCLAIGDEAASATL